MFCKAVKLDIGISKKMHETVEYHIQCIVLTPRSKGRINLYFIIHLEFFYIIISN